MTTEECKARKKELFMEKEHTAKRVSAEEMAAADRFCDGYKQFLNDGKTEREATDAAVRILESKGFSPWRRGDAVKAGDNQLG